MSRARCYFSAAARGGVVLDRGGSGCVGGDALRVTSTSALDEACVGATSASATAAGAKDRYIEGGGGSGMAAGGAKTRLRVEGPRGRLKSGFDLGRHRTSGLAFRGE